mgnify:FL=1|tara:strand:+ start:1330 stop:1743 length:414 start_codon:yes stop_codon:yes gene_type:complete
MEWKEIKKGIEEAFEYNGKDYNNVYFLNTIWNVSTVDLDDKEVSVIVDRDNKLFISKGTKSFVDYEDETVAGMKIPMKCWIHTHPFGKAYFSETDWYTINTQKPILDSAIVLGDNERMKWYKYNGKETLCRTIEFGV